MSNNRFFGLSDWPFDHVNMIANGALVNYADDGLWRIIRSPAAHGDRCRVIPLLLGERVVVVHIESA